jgi:glycosyltransferase involved in cell wall biosynthesis
LNKKEKFWVISNIYYPSKTSTAHILTKISESLKSDIITVLTSTKQEKGNFTLDSRIKVITVKQLFSKSNNLTLRFFDDLLFSLSVFVILAFQLRVNDKIFSVTNPPLILPFLYLIKKLRKVNYTLLVHDVFPDNLILLKGSNLILEKVKYIYNKFYISPDTIIAIGNDMKNFLCESKKIPLNKIIVISNWYDNEIKKIPNFKSKKIRITYSGNLGRMQGFESLFRLIKKIKNKENLIFDFYGTGPIQNELIREVKVNNLNFVKFNGSFKREFQSEILKKSNIALVCLKKGMFGLGVPSKVYNLMALGLPILYIGDNRSEIDNYIREFDIGWSFNWNESNRLLNFLENIHNLNFELIKNKGENAYNLAVKKFSQKLVLNKYELI